MKNGLAIWHYPHRTMTENIEYFAGCGFQSLSLLGKAFVDALKTEGGGNAIAKAVGKSKIILTLHYALPASHEADDVAEYKAGIDAIAKWQAEFGLLSVLSFDVYQSVRDNVTEYIDYALSRVPKARIAVEDFGLNESERMQIEYLKANDRFGYLLDIGHLYIRIRGENSKGTIMSNSTEECDVCGAPSFDEFLRAFKSKQFPIFEIHLHNNDGVNDVHYFLEDGTLDMKMIAEVLKEIGYNNVLTIESAPGFRFQCKGTEADEGIARTYDYWKNCCENA